MRERKRKSRVKEERMAEKRKVSGGDEVWPDGGGRMRRAGGVGAPPLPMNRRYVPKSVLPVTSRLLNNGAALGVT